MVGRGGARSSLQCQLSGTSALEHGSPMLFVCPPFSEDWARPVTSKAAMLRSNSMGGGTQRSASGAGRGSGAPASERNCGSGQHPRALAAKAATATIPIVFYIGLDPVELGLVANLSRPGGNITGVTGSNVTVGPKRLELLHETVPTATALGLLVNPTSPELANADAKEQHAAAQTLGLGLRVLHASAKEDVDAIFAKLVELRVGGLVIGTDLFFNTHKEQLAALSVQHRVPTIHQYREFAAAGGLMSYGTETSELSRQVGVYTGRILKGDKPGDLPVQQATRVELIINMKTARMLGLTIPLPLLGRADEIIE